jgi:predicted component of type VI protein secretion system
MVYPIVSLFDKLRLEPKLYYSQEELYQSISTNLHNIINEKSASVFEMTTKPEQDLIKHLTNKVRIYEPRLINFILRKTEQGIYEISATIFHDGRELDFIFLIDIE